MPEAPPAARRSVPEAPPAARRQLVGADALDAALRQGASLRLVLARRGSLDAASQAVLARVEAAGVPVRRATVNDLRRMSRSEPPGDVLALVGPDPDAPAERVLAGPGPVWLLVGVAYPGNAGFAIRTAEVSGAEGIFLDAALDGAGRKQALRASMHAERFFPVHWAEARAVLPAARAAGRRVVAIEDSGALAPWEVDLRGPLLFVIGGERGGVSEALLDDCDLVLRLPMAGFVPSYNLQAAMAAVAVERLRQVGSERSRG